MGHFEKLIALRVLARSYGLPEKSGTRIHAKLVEETSFQKRHILFFQNQVKHFIFSFYESRFGNRI